MRPREAVREGLKLRVVRYSEQMFTALALPLALPQRPPMPPSPRRRSHRELKPAKIGCVARVPERSPQRGLRWGKSG